MPATGDESSASELDSVFFRPDRPRRADSGLSRERIVAAAVELLDRDGPSALTMRKFAAELGVHATSLYWYVKRREDLIDLAVDEVLGEAASAPVPEAEWDVIVSTTARAMYDAFTSHPWVTAFAGTRPLVGPNALALSARILAALASTGAADRALSIAATTVSNLILGGATATVTARGLGLDDPDSALSRRIIESVGTVQEPPASSVVWQPYFDESLELVMSGVRRLLTGREAQNE